MVRHSKSKAKHYLREALKTGALIVGILAMRSSVASTYVVPTGSMIPTILPGDRFIASQFSYGLRLPFSDVRVTEVGEPRRGDIIVFPSPIEEGIDLVKRVVAVGGDTVEVRGGRLILNGQEVPLDKVENMNAPVGFDLFWEDLGGGARHIVQFDQASPQLRTLPPVKVPPGHFFAMGDNRDHSGDSRVFGPVNQATLRGKALRILFSLDGESFPYFRFTRFGADLI